MHVYTHTNNISKSNSFSVEVTLVLHTLLFSLPSMMVANGSVSGNDESSVTNIEYLSFGCSLLNAEHNECTEDGVLSVHEMRI